MNMNYDYRKFWENPKKKNAVLKNNQKLSISVTISRYLLAHITQNSKIRYIEI